jgi:hypothetical protein
MPARRHIPDGTSGCHSSVRGVPAPGSLFARIPGDWKYDWTAFADGVTR